MSNTIQNQYNPDVFLSPGEILEETIEYTGMSILELSIGTGISKTTLNDIIKGQVVLTPKHAMKLEFVLNVPARLWNNLERNYRESLARKAEKQQLQSQMTWPALFPTRAMAELGWIQRYRKKIEQVQELLSFFGIASSEQWIELWGEKKRPEFYCSPIFQRHPQAVSAWLRQGERQAQQTKVMPYNRQKFRAVLREIRTLTTQHPKAFIPEIQRLCALAGVAVVFVPELPKIKTTTFTRWLNTHKALIEFSPRYQDDEEFWFTFFQQAGHLLLHGKKKAFLENSLEDEQLVKVQNFAARQLIQKA